uniref:BED-type domain-containing protein n=1 Tax=Chenopodium quinoa TaxID=63459 RepID=A0A803MKM4_CHEQI
MGAATAGCSARAGWRAGLLPGAPASAAVAGRPPGCGGQLLRWLGSGLAAAAAETSLGSKLNIMTNNNNNSFFSIRPFLEKDRLNGENFINWERTLRLLLKSEGREDVLENPLPVVTDESSDADKHRAKQAYDRSTPITCLMVVAMEPELQRRMSTNMDNVEGNVPIEEHESDNEKSKPKRKRMKDRSEVWEHFIKEETHTGMESRCKYCGIRYKCGTKRNGTSPLWAHINRCRKYPYNTPKESKQSLLSFKSNKIESGCTSGLSYVKYDPTVIRKALSEMVIVDELRFKFVEGVGFKQFCNVMEPRFHVPSIITVAKDCYETFLTQKRKLKLVLKKCNSRVSLTTDTWTSIQQINYMCLTVHFVDNDWNLQKRILNFCPISSHKGEEIGKEIEKCLLDWELEKVFCITVDNASSNDTAIGYMRRKINGWKAGVLKGRFLHMRCVAHIVNLVVSDGLKIVNESINRVRQAVRFIKQSPSRLVRFKKCVVEEKINSKKLLCLDVPTRWNSTFLMLDAALVFEYAFERYSEEDPHYVIELNEREGKGCPTSEDWETVRRFSEFLQVFYDLTLRVSGSLHVTSNLFFHELVSVAVLLKDLMTNDDVEMCLMATKMKEKYDKYWGDPEKMNMLIIAVVLDPRYKLDYFEWMLIEIYDSKHAFVSVNNLKESLNALYEEYRGSSGDVIREEVSSSMDSSQFSPKQKKLQVLKKECLQEVEDLEEDLRNMTIGGQNPDLVELD